MTGLYGGCAPAKVRLMSGYPDDIGLLSDNGGDTWGRNGQIADVDSWPENNYFAPFSDASTTPISPG